MNIDDLSTYFKGYYPKRTYEETLQSFGRQLENGTSRIGVIENTSREVIGFCKIDTERDEGKLDYLVVLQGYRGNGYGRTLMDWAMEQFRESGIRYIEVRVVDGNEAIHLYEKYGFKMNAHILWYGVK